MTTLRVAFIGDSFTNGAGDPLALGWTGRAVRAAAARGHDITLYNLGIRRDTSADIAARWRDEAARRLPPPPHAAFVFAFGTNDSVIENAAPRVPIAQTLQTTETILAEAKAWAPTLMLSPPPIADAATNQGALALEAAYAPLCTRLEIPYLAVTTALLNTPAWMQEAENNDGAHPKSAGYQALADLVEVWPAWRAWFP